MPAIPRRWTETYLPDWRGRKALVHRRDLRDAGFDDDFLRRLRPSVSLLPGGKHVSVNVFDRNEVSQRIWQDHREAKLAARREARARVGAESPSPTV
jgi:hypothetical protein